MCFFKGGFWETQLKINVFSTFFLVEKKHRIQNQGKSLVKAKTDHGDFVIYSVSGGTQQAGTCLDE